MDIGILGCGTLGRAIAQGLRSHPSVERIAATTRSQRARKTDLGDVVPVGSNRELASISDVVIVCVKPSQVEAVAREIAHDLRPDALVVSAAAAISTAALQEWTGGTAAIVRAMPNMPARIGQGMTALAAGTNADASHLELARELFATLGRVVVVEERLMDAVTGISGCGPAYVYLIVEALAEAGVSLGLPRAVALELAAQTLLGSAAMVLQTGIHPAALKDEVTTPAGCTIDGLLALENGGLRSTLVRAVTAAATRSAQLA